nr:S8 family peptidase [Oceanococcus sp. HetDA_MAG_MS8]
MLALKRAASAAALLLAMLQAPAQAYVGLDLINTAPIYTPDRPTERQRHIVVLDDSIPTAQIPTVAFEIAQLGGAQARATLTASLAAVVVDGIREAGLELLRRDPRVRYIQRDGLVDLNLSTQFNATWGLDRVDQQQRPLDGSYSYETDAANVHAYIIDSGIRSSHNEFAGRIGSGFNTSNDAGGTVFSFSPFDLLGGLLSTPAGDDVEDCNGHGTHVAGTVGGSTWGVAKGVTLHPVRVFGCGRSASIVNILLGVEWVTLNAQRPAVANMSLGGGVFQPLDEAVRASIATGITYVVAAGNENQNACNASPARVTEAVTVGATRSDDRRSSFSNFGTCLDLFAPGQGIRSASHSSDGGSRSLSGTSMAAPHVAGAAALYLANNPLALPAQVEAAITATATEGRVSNARTGSPNLLLYTLGWE